jgi:hypothetical protein
MLPTFMEKLELWRRTDKTTGNKVTGNCKTSVANTQSLWGSTWYNIVSINQSNNQSITHSLTPWSKVLLEKLIGSQLIKKFPAFYGTRMFITAFTNACHLSLSWARPIHFMTPHPTSWRSIKARVFQVVSFPQVSLPNPCIHRYHTVYRQ